MAGLEECWALIESEDYTRAEQGFRALLSGVTGEQARQARFGLGYALAHLHRFEEARDLYRSLRQEARQRGAAFEEHRALHQMGMVDRMAGNWKAAWAVFTEEAELIAALGEPALPVAANRYELGVVTLHLGQLAEAREHLGKALVSARASGDQVAVGCAQRGLGDWAIANGNHSVAREWWEQGKASFCASGSAAAVREMEERLSRSEPE